MTADAYNDNVELDDTVDGEAIPAIEGLESGGPCVFHTVLICCEEALLGVPGVALGEELPDYISRENLKETYR